MASSDPVFLALATLGPDPARDGVWAAEAAVFPAEDPELLFSVECRPFDGAPPRHAPRVLAEAGLDGERLRGLPPWREALAEPLARLAGRRVVVASDADGLRSRFRLLAPDLPPPIVVELEGLAAFLHPTLGGADFPALFHRLCGAAPERRPRAAELRRLLEALLRLHFERPAPLRRLFARGLEELLQEVGPEEDGVWEWLQTVRSLLDRPSRFAGGPAEELFFAELRDGALSEDLDEAPLDAESVLAEIVPRFAEDYRRDFEAADPLPSRCEEPLPLPAEARGILQRYFDLLPHRFAARNEAPRERPGQRGLGEAVARCLDGHELLLADAPTGTGKTLAYLGPLLLWAAWWDQRAAVSTYTRALQEQAFLREVPRAVELLRAAGLPAERTPRVSMLKGRAHSLCGRALRDSVLEPGQGTVVARATWLRLALFWAEDPTGDLDRFPLASGLPEGGRPAAWRAARAMVESVRSLPGCCRGRAMMRCAAGVRTLRAERSHLVVTNHAFVLARPDAFGHVVFDECDHLHEVARSAMSYEIELDEITAMARELREGRGRMRGPLSRLERLLRRLAEGDATERLVKGFADSRDACAELEAVVFRAAREVRAFERFRSEERADRTPEENASLLHEYLSHGLGDGLLAACRELRDLVDQLDSGLRTVVEELGDLQLREARRLRWALRRPLEALAHWREGLTRWLSPEDEEEDFSEDFHFEAHFDERRRQPMLSLEWLLPQKWLGEVYHPSVLAAAYVSATAKLRGGFDAMEAYLGLDLAASPPHERTVATFAGPPTFDPRRALVCVPDDAPPYGWRGPAAAAWQEYVEQLLLFLAERTRGRILGLFTNRRVLARVGERLAPHFRELGVPFLWQGMPGVRKEELIHRFRSRTDSVLLGLDTLWYGVDFPGETCQYVVMTKLPYGAPDLYMHAQMARMGRGPHRRTIYLPKALAMFRQGCGRLLRTEDDKGAVLVLDRRVLDPPHTMFLEELPHGPEPGQEPVLVRAPTGECLRRVFAHMELLADLERRGLDPEWSLGRAPVAEGDPAAGEA